MHSHRNPKFYSIKAYLIRMPHRNQTREINPLIRATAPPPSKLCVWIDSNRWCATIHARLIQILPNPRRFLFALRWECWINAGWFDWNVQAGVEVFIMVLEREVGALARQTIGLKSNPTNPALITDYYYPIKWRLGASVGLAASIPSCSSFGSRSRRSGWLLASIK